MTTCRCSHHHPHGAERGTRLVCLLTLATMLAEILAGWAFGSMALLADGWHMAGHAGAMAMAWLAYVVARTRQADAGFVFGPGKVTTLAGFVSALGLGLVAVLMAVESVGRLVTPAPIAFTEAMVVAVLGLAVNLASAWLLRDREHGRHAGDHNLQAAYLHVLADALTSVLAIAALAGGRFWGLTWLDPLMGVVGAAVVGAWSLGLVRDTAAVLLDRRAPEPLLAQVRHDLEAVGARVRELALWYVGPGQLAASVCLAAARPAPPETYGAIVRRNPEVAFVRVEVHSLPCPAEADHA